MTLILLNQMESGLSRFISSNEAALRADMGKMNLLLILRVWLETRGGLQSHMKVEYNSPQEL